MMSEKELSTWEQRMQSNPTELDELLSASTAKISELDAIIISLQDRLRDESAAHAAAIDDKDIKMAELDKRVVETEALEAESRAECDAMREELSALSEAYTRLEDDYRVTQENLRQQEIRQTEGEESGQDGTGGSTEVATLRAENHRLMDSAAQAQTWMTMADQKITEQESELAVLRQQSQYTLPDGNNSTQASDEILALQNELATVRAHTEEELRIRDGKIEQLQSGMAFHGDNDTNTVREENIRLNLEAEQAQEWMAMAEQRMNTQAAELLVLRQNNGSEAGLSTTEDVDENAALQKELQSLRDQLASARLQIESEGDIIERDRDVAKLCEENDRLNREAEEAQKWIARTEERMKRQEEDLLVMQQLRGGNGLSTSDRRDEVTALDEELNHLREELASVRLQSEEDVRERDDYIRQLETSNPKESTNPEESAEIVRLREANQAAEAWMQEAYNHHQSLADQISTLTEENNNLIDQCNKLEAELSNEKTRFDDQHSSMNALTTELQALRSQPESSTIASIEELTKRCSALEAELLVEKQEVALLQSRSLQTTDAVESDKVAELEQQIASLKSEILELQSSKSDLLQRVSDLETTQIEVGATKEEIEQLRIKAHDAESRKASIEKIRDAVAKEKAELALESEKNQNTLAHIQNELNELRRRENSTTADSGTFDDELIELREENENLRNQMESKEEEAKSVISQWQKSNEQLRLRIQAIENEMMELSNEKDLVLQDLCSCQTSLKEIQGAADDPKKEATKLEGTLLNLRSQVENLKEQLEDQENDHAEELRGWQDAYNEASADGETLRLEKGSLEERLAQALAEVENSRSNEVHNVARDDFKSPTNQSAGEDPQPPNQDQSLDHDLHDQFKTLQQESRTAIQEWQDAYESKVGELEDVQNRLESQLRTVLQERDSLLANGEELEKATLKIYRLEQGLAELHEQLGIAPSPSDDFEQRHEVALSVVNDKNQAQMRYDEAVAELQVMKQRSQDTADDSFTSANLLEQLDDQRKESEELVRMWEESYNALQSELERLTAEKDEELSNVRLQLESARHDMSVVVHCGESQRLESKEEMGDAGRPEHQLTNGSDSHIAEVKVQETNEVVATWQERYREQEDELDSLRNQLEDHHKETADLVGLWEQRCNELQSELDDLQSGRDDGRCMTELDTNNPHSPNPASFDSNNGNLDPAENEPEHIKGANDHTVEGKLREAYEIVTSWQERYQELEAELEASRKQFEDQQVETADLVELWEQRCNELQSELDGLQRNGNGVSEQRSPKADQQDIQHSIQSNQILELSSEVEELRNQVKESNELILSWKGSYDAIKQDHDETLKELAEKSALLVSEKTKLIDEANRAFELEAKISDFVRQIEDHEADIKRWEAAYNEIAEERDQLQNQQLPHKDDHSPINDSLRSQLQKLTSELDYALQENESYKTNAAEIEKMIEERESLLNKYKNELEIKAAELNDAENVVREWEASYQDVVSELQRLKPLDDGARESMTGSTDSNVCQGTADEIQRLEAVLLERMESEATYVSKIQLLEKEQEKTREVLDKEVVYLSKIEALEEKMENLRLSNGTEPHEAEVRYHELQGQLHDAISDRLKDDQDSPNGEYMQRIEALKLELQNNMIQAESTVAEWEESYQVLSSQLSETENQLAAARALIQEQEQKLSAMSTYRKENAEDFVEIIDPDVLHEYETKIDSLEAAITSLEQEKEQDAEHARTVIGSWEVEYQAILEELEQTRQWKDNSSTHEAVMAESAQHVSELKEEIEELQQSLDRILYEKSAFEAETKELRTQLAMRSSEVEQLRRDVSNRSDVDLQQTTPDLFESRITDLLSTIQNLQHELDMARGEKTSLEIRVASLDDNFKSQIEAAKAENSRTKETLEAERAKDFEKLARVEDDMELLRREKASWEQECINLRSEYSNLAEELEETRNSLQLTLTDKATSEASHAAASVMKHQLENLQDKLESIQQALARERDAKEIATAEADRLRSNIAALLGMEDNDENKTAMEQRLMEATDSLQRMERSEISALKDSLSRTLNELSEARSSEKKMEEKAASASHRASLYEAEVVNTKNDFNFLSRTLDDIRDSEASKISSLEFRLSSIQNEHSVQTKIYAAELENLRNELSQSNLERDRLLQALNESESIRESKSQASSPDLSYGGNAANELAQLRIEKTQLLSAATAEASRAEKRLRDNRAMIKAAAEAEVIMERELRLMAERSLESAKAELESARVSASTHALSRETGIAADQIVLLQNQLDEARSSREKLEHEISVLQTQLSDTKRERDMDVARMTEECQKMRVRINHVEREGRFEAQVIAEAARLKASESTTVAAPEAKEERSEEVIALWDHIKKLQDGIKKERTMYYEKKSEHDDLLALLARQDLEKEKLSGALASLGGQEAVQAAMTQAASAGAFNHLSL